MRRTTGHRHQLPRSRRSRRLLRRGTSLVGILVSMAILVVLFAVAMSAINKAVTGEGNTRGGTVRGLEDQIQLNQIAVACFIAGRDNGTKGAPMPSELVEDRAGVTNTTAAIYSTLIAQKYFTPETIVSKNERSANVYVCGDYNYAAYDPAKRKYWDSNFKADLQSGSNASFAHVPLYGTRKSYWTDVRLDSTFPIMGSRGPKEGQPNPQSLSYGRDGTWAGFRVFGDGHVAFTQSLLAEGLAIEDGKPDNAFAIDGPVDGNDAVLAFTRVMNGDGPRLQWD